MPNQGYCNANYLLKKDGKNYHVREFKILGLDREFEFKVQSLAYKKAIGAKPFVISQTHMVGEFLKGGHKKKLNKRNIALLAKTIKKLHTIRARKKAKPFNQRCINLASKFSKDLVLSHNDINVKNVLFSSRCMLIDWEYAGLNDRYFDLASISCEYKFSQKDEVYFFKHYGKKLDRKKLKVYKRIYDILYKAWFKQLEAGELEFLA